MLTTARQRSAPQFDVQVEENVWATLRDGVRLAADIYYPTVDGARVAQPLPAVLLRTPYDKGSQPNREQTGPYFARRGYVVVIQDVRGRYASEGVFTKYTGEGPDGYDTIEWIAAQPWCNGKIGTTGTSYLAHTQMAAAALNPPHLACMYLNFGGFFNGHTSAIRQGGALELKQLTWAWTQALESPAARADPTVRAALQSTDLRDWFWRLPLKQGHSPLSLVPEYEGYLLEMWRHGAYDDYWKQVGINAQEHYDRIADVPTVHQGGWYDPYTRSTTDHYVQWQASKRAPALLVLGPWTHGGVILSRTYSGEVDMGPEAPIDGNLAQDFNDLQLRWFDQWLKGMDTGLPEEPPVWLFVMGGGSGRRNAEGRMEHGGRWRKEQEWPLARTHLTSYFLHAGGALRAEAPAEAAGASSYAYDPQNPVPTLGGNISSGAGIIIEGAFDQRERPDFFACKPPYLPLASRHDVLVFQTEPLDRDVEVTGPVTVHLWVSSSAADTDFTAKLVDVHPPNEDYPLGFAMNLCDGILRARYRESADREVLMEPGKVYPISFPLYPTSNLFQKGHRIRLDISSSNFPRFDLNPNTGGPQGQPGPVVVARNTVHHDATHPSHVALPVIPQP
ncbi:MAG: CocE/NonD family hydrolase [Chloroflexi bacterium]|nr:CocE/NonD family hydrolase [Chloroflexota bacterium]